MSNKKFQVKINRRNVPSEEMVSDVARVAKELGKNTVTIDEYKLDGQFHPTTLQRRFGSWFKVMEAAGLERSRNLGISDDELFENIVELWTKLGRQPTYQETNPPLSRYSSGTYANRFGSWGEGLLAFQDWIDTDGTELNLPETAKANQKRTPRKPNWRLRAKVLMRDGATCQLCGATPQTGATLHIDHRIPWSKGGETLFENLWVLCEICNIGKSAEAMPDD